MNASEKILGFSGAIDKARRIAIVTHTHPDGDAIGSSGAMLGYIRENRSKNATIVLPDALSHTLDFAKPEAKCGNTGSRTVIEADSEPEAAATAIATADLLICLDFNTPSRIGTLENALRDSQAFKILIDHHLNPDTDCFDITFSETDISSASELLYKVLMQMPDIGGDVEKMPLDVATSLMIGMTTDTNNFANSVFPSTLEMASALLSRGVDRDGIILHLYNEYRESRLRAMAFMVGEKMKVLPCGAAYIIITKDEIERFDLREGETEGLVNIPLGIGTVRLSILLKQDDNDYFRVSIRSKRGTSANLLARGYFNGGGHECASGGRLYIPRDIEKSEDAAAYIENATEKFLGEHPSKDQNI